MNGGESSIKNVSSIIMGVAGRIIVFALLILAAFTAVNFSFRFGYTVFCADAVDEPPGRDVEIVIAKGETIDELADRLYEDGVIPSEYAFRIQARLYDIGFYPGTYRLNTSMSTREILKTIDMTEQEYADSLALEAASAATDSGVISGGDEGAADAEDAGAAKTAGDVGESESGERDGV